MSGLQQLKQLAKKYIYKGRNTISLLEGIGLQILPCNFYSPVPSIKEIEEGWEQSSLTPYYEKELYDNDEMTALLQNDLMPYSTEFNPKQDGDENTAKEYFWNNPTFSHSDAMSLYCFIRKYKPKRVLEIGGGFSTLIIDQALKLNGYGEIWEIEPYPRPFMDGIQSITRNFKQPVQQIPLELFEELESGDILFIDSTHTVKASSDCTYIYLKALNKLANGVIIHSHDIFLPGSIPINWHFDHQLYWTEHYLLQALLLNSAKFKIMYGSNYHNIFNSGLLDSFMDSKAKSGGGSLWYRIKA